ncbi:MAG: hypothetical protein MUP53_06585 [Bacteroidales bacterium]|nr:hypothetical protein [Bacteroidales bacterium]
MKRIIAIMVLLSAICCLAKGQWYYKKYEVNTLEEFTPEQYSQALHDAKYLAIGSAVCSGAGVGIYFIGRSTLKNGLDEDATLFETILGSKGTGYGTMGLGVATFAGGIIGTLVGVSRIGMIKRSGSSILAPQESVNISPVMIMNQHYGTATPGAMITVRF